MESSVYMYGIASFFNEEEFDIAPNPEPVGYFQNEEDILKFVTAKHYLDSLPVFEKELPYINCRVFRGKSLSGYEKIYCIYKINAVLDIPAPIHLHS